MNKGEFVEKLAKKTGMTKKAAQASLDATFDLITHQVKKKGKVTFTGFGTFEARQQKATERINPQTGKKMKVPDKQVIKFRPGKHLKEAMDGK